MNPTHLPPVTSDLLLHERIWLSLLAVPRISLRQTLFYTLFAGATWLLLHVLMRRAMKRRRISNDGYTWEQLRREVLCSFRSVGVFGLVGGAMAFAAVSGWTQLYWRLDEYGWGWLFGSFLVMVVIHDTYFYWTHRLLHQRWLFRRFHRLHHLSSNPSPWAAYSFSIGEALVQAGIGPLVIFTLPVHPLAFVAFSLWQIAFNVLGHCGYEIYPSWFLSSGLGSLLNSPTHHAMHHEKYRANYGLYFNWWDRLMNTNHRQYGERFAEVTGGSR